MDLPKLSKTGEEAQPDFDLKYHIKNNPGACKRDHWRGCRICGWRHSMAIHDADNIGTIQGWAHLYRPQPDPRIEKALHDYDHGDALNSLK